MRAPAHINWQTHQAIKVGRLQMIGRLDVMPGDSLAITAGVRTEYNKLRRNAGVSLVQETFAFYAPWRWTYGNSFVAAATKGWSTAQTWQANQTLNQGDDAPALMLHGNVAPRHLVWDYAEIVDHYFKEPHQPSVTNNNVFSDNDDQTYGYRCWQLRDSWETSPNWDDKHDEEKILNENMPALSLPKYVRTGKDNQMRTWDAVRKEDIYRATFKGHLSNEAVFRPIHLHYDRQAVQLKGENIEPTESTQIASARSGGRITIPRRFYAEHGTIYILSLTRVKPTYWQAQPLLDIPSHLANQKKSLGHPVGNSESPLELNLDDIFSDAPANTSAGWVPWYSWMMRRPDFWSPVIRDNDEGWPARDTPTTKAELHRHPEYEDIWTSKQFGHGVTHASISAQGHRPVTGGRSSIMGQ